MDNTINKPVSNQFTPQAVPKHSGIGQTSSGAKFGQALAGGAVQVAGKVVNTVAGGNVLGLGPLGGGGGIGDDIAGVENDLLGNMRTENERLLRLQQSMQQESQRFNTFSNISKQDHDTRMNAVRNVKS